MRTTRLLIATTALLMAACSKDEVEGDISRPQSDTEPSQASSPTGAASAASSAACFNEGFLRAGSRTDFEITVEGTNGATPARRTASKVTGPTKFNGAVVTETQVQFYGDDGKPVAINRTYGAVEDGYFVSYGETGDAVVTLNPPKKKPIAMEPGQTFEFRYETKSEYNDHSETSVTEWSETYLGREILKSAVGVYEACKFKSHEVTTPNGGTPQVFDKVVWAFAEGPYRGLGVRQDVTAQYPGTGLVIKQRIEVTKVNEFSLR